MKIFTILTILAFTSAYKITQLKVPLYADPRRAAELICDFQMNDEILHSVKWYRDMHEILRYNPSQVPSIRLFNVTGIIVQGGECQAEWCMVRVMPLPFAVRAAFTCEISTEGPRFQIARQTKHMTVVAMPERDPVIIGAPKLVRPGEHVLLNCSSDFSLPPANINWYIGNEVQKQEMWQRTKLSLPQAGGLRASWRVLHLAVPTVESGALRMRCEAELPVEPPVIRDTSVVLTLYSRTQLSKYVSNTGARIDFQLVWATMCVYVLMVITL
ncbi:uncharacterized protein LOC111000126 isoform X1 [Pieris rapae]|uniref:uncharacterized protein LOC111000126 isoform X1 n=2 Tax=Pieris rapae TaxID=64459 RepID=UPI001E27CCC7|nr:uncharacterized protein LOC111000126 isoform X1 [Pieris rapae]